MILRGLLPQLAIEIFLVSVQLTHIDGHRQHAFECGCCGIVIESCSESTGTNRNSHLIAR
jgi:hypothetical protein